MKRITRMLPLAVLGVALSSLAFAEGDPEAGKKLAAGCAGCHGETGIASDPKNPNLAGQHEQALYDAMMAYKEGKRDHPVMKAALAKYSEQEVWDMAAYYANQSCK